jgi:pyruvate/2-oxoglutarate dehydrogenase complex dihydrolipoamide dehydrogenase (E3) component
MKKRIVIIGGGPAGIEAALAAERSETSVTIISDGPIGGRAGWHSLLPSKVWLSAAEDIARFGEAISPTERSSLTELSPANVVQRIGQVKQNWNKGMASVLEERGVDLIEGTASFVDKATVDVRVGEGEFITSLEADSFIVASGSVPIFPPNLKPDGKKVIAPRFASQLNKLPKSMIVVGAGATGCESAYLFNRYGVDVTWIVDQFGILPQFNQDLGRALGIALVRQGIRVVQGQMVERLERDDCVTAILADGAHFKADMAFVAIGRKPDWDRINLSAAGLSPDSAGQIHTNKYGLTENEKIYLVGDAAGGAMVANKAMAQARIAGSHAAGIPVSAYDSALIVQVTYTEPQAAQLGDTRSVEGVQSVRIPYVSALKAHLLHTDDGFLEIFFGTADRQLRGAMGFGSHAADVLTPLVIALRLCATVDQLASIYAPHPTLSELAFIAARAA